MLKRLIATITPFIACMAMHAQETCVINGHITDLELENGKKVKKVYLMQTDEFGRKKEMGTAKVKKGMYTFKYDMAKNEPITMYTIEGFGNNAIELFVEPGNITVNTEKAAQPLRSKVSGTPVNDTFSEYKEIYTLSEERVADALTSLERQNGKDWLKSKEGKNAIKRAEATEKIKTESEIIRFLIDHNNSPMTPLEMERKVMPNLSIAYAEQMVKSIAVPLHDHPYFLSFRNAFLARNLKVGNEIPDISLHMQDGCIKRISDYRGKYILLDFWKSTCDRSVEERAEIRRVYDIIKEKQEQFAIVSISLDENDIEWKNAIKNNGMDYENWGHGRDHAGKKSAAVLLGVEETPRMVLVDPEGRAISLDMKSEEVVERVEQILAGDLYYLDQE